MVQTLGLINLRECFQDQPLIIPQSDGAIFVAQPFANTGVKCRGKFRAPPAEGRKGLGDFFDGGIGLVELADCACWQKFCRESRVVAFILESHFQRLRHHHL